MRSYKPGYAEAAAIADSPTLTRQLDELTRRGYEVRRPSGHHVKIGPVNYFWSTGAITIDPCTRHSERGFRALLVLLKELPSKSEDDEWDTA